MVTEAAGINHDATAPGSPQAPTFAQVQAGGAAAGDFDGDGWVDLYVTRYFDKDVLYRNNRDGTFVDVSSTVFLGGIEDVETNGATWGDIDNDGDLDLAVATMNEGRHRLYINDGLGHLAEQGSSRGLLIDGGAVNTRGTSFSMGDYDNDGYLDMYVTAWKDFVPSATPLQARLFRNEGAANPGHFVDVTSSAGVAVDITSGVHAGKELSFTPRFSDLDRDGHLDIAVIADGKASRVFWNQGDGTFADGTAVAGINTGTNDMGFTLGDFNGDGLLDWFATSIGFDTGTHPSGNRLFLNNGNRTFSDATDAAGVREGGWGWAADAFDFDNDGDLDIAHSNGMTIAFPFQNQSVFFRNDGDREQPQLVDVATQVGITDQEQGRGLLTFDYDRDGDLDMFVVNYSGPPMLYRNDGGNVQDWLDVRTVGDTSNRGGVGAYLTVTPDLSEPDVFYVREMNANSNYLAQSEMMAHFGLGDVETIDQVTVQWPSGYVQHFEDVAPNQVLVIGEGLLADFNRDDSVNDVDLQLWTTHFGGEATDEGSPGDADWDGDIDGADLLKWQRQYGRTLASGILSGVAGLNSTLVSGAANTVPEPHCSIVILTVLTAMTLPRRALEIQTRFFAGIVKSI
ncbi:CRTAC1 family protein [Bythopirellula goksoeyrii]|uniref:CRTAC1 family protein n=1 Tax=Bythopirellula goksoeyrii TaxID=1400387 RepID=UPI00143D83AE|nr:CRTAC1 family protein [Bythopirellula goksoeyrii]